MKNQQISSVQTTFTRRSRNVTLKYGSELEAAVSEEALAPTMTPLSLAYKKPLEGNIHGKMKQRLNGFYTALHS